MRGRVSAAAVLALLSACGLPAALASVAGVRVQLTVDNGSGTAVGTGEPVTLVAKAGGLTPGDEVIIYAQPQNGPREVLRTFVVLAVRSKGGCSVQYTGKAAGDVNFSAWAVKRNDNAIGLIIGKSTTVIATFHGAAPTPTKVTLSFPGEACTMYLVAEDNHATGETCTAGEPVNGNWTFKLNKNRGVLLTASVDKPLPPGTSLQVNGSPPLCKVEGPGETMCTAKTTIGPYPTLTGPQAVDVSVGYATSSGGTGPSLTLLFGPNY